MSHTLLTDGSWTLQKRDEEAISEANPEYWIRHSCREKWVFRYDGYKGNHLATHGVSLPCWICHKQAPEALIGIYNMIVYL